MRYEFDIVELTPVTLAVAEELLRPADIPTRIIPLFDTVYAWLPTADVAQAGHNYAVYDHCGSGAMRMRAGFPVSGRFTDTDLVKCVNFEGRRAAHTRHQGPYNLLFEANSQLNAWCDKRCLVRAGISWEVYGDWHEDESMLITDIYIGVL